MEGLFENDFNELLIEQEGRLNEPFITTLEEMEQVEKGESNALPTMW